MKNTYQSNLNISRKNLLFTVGAKQYQYSIICFLKKINKPTKPSLEIAHLINTEKEKSYHLFLVSFSARCSHHPIKIKGFFNPGVLKTIN